MAEPGSGSTPLPPGITMTEVDLGLIGPAEIQARFGFHKAAIEGENASTKVHSDLRMEWCEFAEYLDHTIPAGREKDILFERLEEASMWSHKALAYGDPIVDERPQIGTPIQQGEEQ